MRMPDQALENINLSQLEVGMKRVISKLLITVLVLIVIGDASAGDLEIKNAWVRSAPAVARVTAGFATLVNHGEQDDRLIAVSAKFARGSSLHDTQTEAGMVHMIPQDSIALPAGAQVDLAPGGLHIMFSQFDQDALVAGSEVGLVFHFERAGLVESRASVKSFKYMAEHHSHH